MSQPTHFIEVWKHHSYGIMYDLCEIKFLEEDITSAQINGFKIIAIFKIKFKEP